ncbi:unnamed protein product, partial [Amoebophrya sp. A25]|eukprot:GSA25T00027681001.1
MRVRSGNICLIPVSSSKMMPMYGRAYNVKHDGQSKKIIYWTFASAVDPAVQVARVWVFAPSSEETDAQFRSMTPIM